jgi:spore coat polysaccharide biosynthesis protein SpsF
MGGTNVVTVVQARLSSTRLPGKALLPLCGEPLLLRMVQRVKAAKKVGTVVVATTTHTEDDAIVAMCEKNKIEVYRGSKFDLLDRHYQVASRYKADVVVKIPSDCPLIDAKVIDRVLEFFLASNGKLDYASNLHPATYPDGNDVEVMSFAALEQTWENAIAPMELEHTTPYIWDRPHQFNIGNVTWDTGLDYSMTHRWTIDYAEDYDFIKQVYDKLFRSKPEFTLQDILKLLDETPSMMEINGKWAGVNWYRNHLHELKTINKQQTRIVEQVS